ncbi:uncharacterized protein LOC111336527 isoform X2 [Stylophora pistillata]|uniref:uncharacterized protein LOC111336527 isoform X2 n=1 Tax=Stylophora pistillata TaxID=50429 RepID=UPI000C051D91|nr:uncharacterized protein LOC111336527 isoform X2 [Stylophora pistillata]
MWLLNGTRISHGDRHKMIRDTTICKPRKLFTLKIINVTENDEGRYTCCGYKNGIKATKDLFLKTEPCPSGYYCPPEGNTAFPFPRSPPTPTPGISKEDDRETRQGNERSGTSSVITQGENLKTELAPVSRGYSFHRPDRVSILLFAALAFTYITNASNSFSAHFTGCHKAKTKVFKTTNQMKGNYHIEKSK